ncbi:glycosyl hydrolase family 44 [Cohnella sp. SGD-V74]|uniref:glycoside hydrolase family 44 protein n=1 Tax=unclassified Cohnella TaxID=2636738 RepID=UPI000B8C3116|nr:MULTISPECIES: glycoside hydrolase family 44 protein [unclassified Cohnella]PRX73994.1 glycosyl hydrolase family 44 [Cohnella sp. SGD-V74]
MGTSIKAKGPSKMALLLTTSLLFVQLAVPGERTFGSEASRLNVFDDRLEESFHNNSWAGVSLEETGTVYEGSRSIRFEAKEGQAVYLYKDRIMNAGEYDSFSFWLRGSGQGGQSFKLAFTLGGQALAELDSADLLPDGIPANEWVQVTVPLGDAGVQGWMDGILIWGAGQQGPLFLDNISFTGQGGGEEPGGNPGEEPGGEPGGENPGEEPGEEPGNEEPGDPIEPVEGFYLYDDKLADSVTNYSWGQVNLTDSSVKRTGSRSIRFTPNGDGALYLYSSQLLTVNDYDKLRLWVHGGSEGGQKVQLALTAGGATAFERPLEHWLPEGVPAGEWALIELNLAELGLEHRLFDGIRLTGLEPGKQAPLYLDDIAITSRQAAQAAVLELRIDQPRLVMLPGERRQIQAETLLQSGDTAIVTGDTQWTIDQPELLSVEGGELVALQPGIAKITATHKNFTTDGFVQITEVQAESVYEESLAPGFHNYSWHEKDFANTEQARSGSRSIKFEPDGWDGVWVSGESKKSVEDYYGIRFWLHGGSTGGQELLFHFYNGNQSLGSLDLNEVFPNGSLPAGQWTEVTVGMADLGLDLGFFDGFIVQAATENNQEAIYIDDIAFLSNPNAGQLPEPELPLVTVTVDQTSERKPISNDIYGINYDEGHPTTSTLPFTVERWGGNQTTRYNWQLNAANRASDWFFINYPYDDQDWEPSQGSLSDRFIDRVLGRGNQVLMTIPTIGWTPKDRTVSYGFSQQKYGSQQEGAWELPDAGNGVFRDGTLVTNNDPSDTSVRVGTEFAADWVRDMAAKSNDKVRLYALDNEPDLWHVTHRDVHPEAPTYDELWNKTVEYGTAIKQADPDAQLLGPVSWGWCGYFYSPADWCADGPDRQAHGGTPFLEWYLQQANRHEQETGVKLIDYLTIHYYSQEGVVPSENESPQVSKRRFQALKALYDDQFVDQSWIQEPIRLIPRMKEIIERNRPGLKLAITEYNFGNGFGVTAGLAQAEALAIFGKEGVDLATRFGNFQADTPIEDAFKLYLDYDGQGSKIEGSSVSTDSSRFDAVGAYTIEGNDGKTYVLLFNKDTLSRDVQLELGEGFDTAEAYTFDAIRRLAKTGDLAASENGSVSLKLSKRSATLLVVNPSN